MSHTWKTAPCVAALLLCTHAADVAKAPPGADPAAASAAAAVTHAIPPAAGNKLLMAYYPNWAHYSGYSAENIPYQYLTHILYAFYITDGAGNLRNSDPPDEENFKKLIGLAHAKGVQVLLSIGGAGQSEGFKSVASSAGNRASFIKNILRICEEYKLDGFDLDWEYPLEGDGANQERFHKEIRAALDKLPRKLLFTAAVPVVDYWAHWSSDEAFKQLDYLNCMTYDYMGTWEKAVIPNSGMDMSRNSLDYWEKQRGVPRSKLLIGSAFYGKSFDGGTGMGSGFEGKGSGNDGIWIWKDLLKQFEASPYKIYWDAKTESEYAVGNEEIIVFNGIPSQRVRGEFIRNSEYAGVMFWEILSDSPKRDKSLLVALYRGLRGTNKTALVLPPKGPEWTVAAPAP